MRIGMFTDAYTPDINGVVSSIVTLKNALEKEGHEVYVITTKSSASKDLVEERVLRLAGIELDSFYGYVLTSPIHLSALEKIKKMNLDVIHVHTEFGVGIFARIVSSRLSIPLVSTYHTMYEDYTHYVNIFNLKSVDRVAKRAVYSLSKLYGEKCTALICPSPKTKERLEAYGIKKQIHVIPTGLDLERFEPEKTDEETRLALRKEMGVKDDEFLLVYVGRIAAEKSIDIVIETFTIIKKLQKKIRLAIVGGGPQLEELRQMAKDLNLEDYVVFTDRKPHTMIPSYYHASDAFVSASLSETQGMTFIEALASGLVVFARPDDVLTDLVLENETGFLFTTKEEFADKLIAFSEMNKADKEKMYQNAIKKVEIYDSRVFGQTVLNVYQQAIDMYQKVYDIQALRMKDDMIEMLLSSQGDELKVTITWDLYLEKKYHINAKIMPKELEELLVHEKYAKAYLQCIRKIASKDRTRKEMYDFLTNETELDIKSINEIIEKLEKKGYINDAQYMISQIEAMRALKVGNHKIVRTLVKKGIPQETVENELANEDHEEEVARGVKWAQKQLGKPTDSSMKMKKVSLQKKLYQQGYETETVNEIMSLLEFEKDEDVEYTNLMKQAQKAWKRYCQKYEGTKLRNTVFRYLVSKGFDYDDVYNAVEEVEQEYDKD